MDLKASGIYAITSPSGRVYIGSAYHFSKRFGLHRSQFRTKRHHCPPLQAAYEKYGIDHLTFSVVEYCGLDVLLTREQFYLDHTPNKYNVCPTAGSCAGRQHTPETKAKIGAAHKGRIYPAEVRARMSAAQLGKKISAEHAAKLLAARLGLKVTELTRARQSAALKGRKHAPESIEKGAITKFEKTTRSGFRGVKFREKLQRWYATAKVGGKRKWLGYHDTPELAAAARETFLRQNVHHRVIDNG